LTGATASTRNLILLLFAAGDAAPGTALFSTLPASSVATLQTMN
jgi:hypothetical protein